FRDLRRKEARKLLALAFDGLEELDVRDGDGRLVGERSHKFDRFGTERANLAPSERNHAEHDAVADERDSQKGADMARPRQLRGAVIGATVVLDGVSHMDRA